MARLELIGGSYSARAAIANCQRAINYFPEPNIKDAPVQVTHYQRPGFRPRTTGPLASVRCLYRASDSSAYCVIGSEVFSISRDWQLHKLGSIATNLATPCSMIDNGIDILLVDGSVSSPLAGGWTINLNSNAFAQVSDVSGSFQGADKVDYIDTFLLWNKPGTRQFGSTLSDTISPFDPTYVASKTNYPDLLQTLIVNRHEIILLGSLKGEIWYDNGGAQFPFAELPGTVIEHGIAAKYSLASSDITTFWLGQDLQGQGMVFRLRGYEVKVISNYALAEAIKNMYETSTISDAIGYTYQQSGHVFYVLSFPAGNQTWVFDDSIGDPNLAWHQRCWTDGNGNLHRDRSNCFGFINGLPTVGDWENGTIYTLDTDVYTDTVHGTVCPISYIRTFPHILIGTGPDGQPMMADGRLLEFKSFTLDLEVGDVPLDAAGKEAQVGLRWSDTRGRTWKQEVLQSAGAPGQYITQPDWSMLGSGRDVVFEISHSIRGPAALNGAWVEAKVLNT